MKNKDVIWKIKPFEKLTVPEFHAIAKARIDVFIVEQNCPYPDLDGADDKAVHIWAEYNSEIIAYCRIFQTGLKYKEASIGRVLTNQNFRKMDFGRILMKLAIGTIEARFRTYSIKISAQNYLLHFYADFGFTTLGESYLEDEIPHTEMIRKSLT